VTHRSKEKKAYLLYYSTSLKLYKMKSNGSSMVSQLWERGSEGYKHARDLLG
jgi:hypothetical protein